MVAALGLLASDADDAGVVSMLCVLIFVTIGLYCAPLVILALFRAWSIISARLFVRITPTGGKAARAFSDVAKGELPADLDSENDPESRHAKGRKKNSRLHSIYDDGFAVVAERDHEHEPSPPLSPPSESHRLTAGALNVLQRSWSMGLTSRPRSDSVASISTLYQEAFVPETLRSERSFRMPARVAVPKMMNDYPMPPTPIAASTSALEQAREVTDPESDELERAVSKRWVPIQAHELVS